MKLFCTIVSRAYLPYARTLADSLRSSGNTEPLHVLVTDLPAAETETAGNLVLTSLDRLAGTFPPAMCRYFDAFELCNALKPFFVTHLIHAAGAIRVIYLDADIYATGSFARLWEQLESVPLLLSLHQFTPPPLAPTYPKETDIVDMGFINGGFAAWRAGAATERILAWMRERFPQLCFCDRAAGMFVDQKLLPLLLAYFPADVRLLRDPGVNVAYWNSYERAVSRSDGRWLVDDYEVVFFHLSGYRLSCPESPSIYLTPEANTAVLRRAPWLAEVIASYRSLLAAHTNSSRPSYGFARLDGVELNRTYRRMLFRDGRLDRASLQFWRTWVWERLRSLKRRLTGVQAHH